MQDNLMYSTHHRFHIPVMGTGFTIDSALKVARFGIGTVISLVDDILIERVRKHYCKIQGLEFVPILQSHPDFRAARVTAYLNLVQEMVDDQIDVIRKLPFGQENDKRKYFELLPKDCSTRILYSAWLKGSDADKLELEPKLNALILPGTIDVNIMTKLDRLPFGKDGSPLPLEYSDAKSAFRGFALSKARGSMVFSAGINPTLYGSIEKFPDFYRQADGTIKKGIILKVTDFRSSMIQGRFLAKKGVEVREFRIESALNCGGHAFASDGFLLGPILQEFKDSRAKFPEIFEPLIENYYRKKGLEYSSSARNRYIQVTAQGGIGINAEMGRLLNDYGMDAVGWASPFLLVPEVTSLDAETRRQLADAGEDDLYQSEASPLGILFNNMRNSSSEKWTIKQIDDGKPGSACPKGYLVSNTEFTEKPICTASKQYQGLKLKAMGFDKPPPQNYPDPKVQYVYAKQCICDQLANGALIEMSDSGAKLPVSVCPGPNIAYFDREYSLVEMVSHIYGTIPSLVPADRPHMFSKDLLLYVDYFEKRILRHEVTGEPSLANLSEFRDNLIAGMDYYKPMLSETAQGGENLESLAREINFQSARIEKLWLGVNAKADQHEVQDSILTG